MLNKPCRDIRHKACAHLNKLVRTAFKLLPQFLDHHWHCFCQPWDNFSQVLPYISGNRGNRIRQLFGGSRTIQKVVKGCLCGVHGTFDSGRCFLGRCAGYIKLTLDYMDGRVYVIQIADVIFHAGYFGGIRKEAVHLLLCSTITQFQVVQHRIILLCESLICILDGRHVCPHLIGVIRHVHHCHIGYLCRFCRIPGHAL